MFYLMTHSTHLRLYGVGHMVKNHSDSQRGNLLLPHGLFFLVNNKDSFICAKLVPKLEVSGDSSGVHTMHQLLCDYISVYTI